MKDERKTAYQGKHAVSPGPSQVSSTTPVVPLRPSIEKGKKSSSLTRRGFVALGSVAVVGIAGGFIYTHRSVALTLNGSPISVPVGITAQELIDSQGLSPQPGNLISVSGNTLTQGAGDAFSLTVDNKLFSKEEAANWHAAGGETVEIGNGADIMEDYDVTIEETQPKLETTGIKGGAVRYVSQWGKVGKKEIRTGKKSGEVADGDVLQEAQNCIITNCNITPDNNQKVVGISFDDGPSSFTQDYLDILADRNVSATFFNIGKNVDSLSDIPPKVIAAGHHIASHTYSHPFLTKDTPEEVRNELSQAAESIKQATGVETTMLRPPYGDFDMNSWLASGGLISSEILWNQDTLDWKQPGVDKIVSNALSGIKPGAIILMHDGGGKRDQDLEALPKIIDSLMADGYRVLSVNDLMKTDSSIPADIADGTARMPDDAVWPTELA